MPEEEKSREKILKAAEAEFLQKGFTGASLRGIAGEAGVTTGSFYWHFKNKEELFEALVGAHYDHIMGLYRNALAVFFELSPEEQRCRVGEIGRGCMEEMLEYIYQHKTEFKLLIDGAAGTKYENMIHELTEAEIDSTHVFAERMKELGIESRQPGPELEHILVSGMFTGMFELVRHDVPIGEARECAKGIHDFYSAGWREILNVPKEKMPEE